MINRITSKRKEKPFKSLPTSVHSKTKKTATWIKKHQHFNQSVFPNMPISDGKRNNKNTKQKKHRLKIDNCGAPCHGVAGRSRICASLSQVDQREKLQSMDPSPRPDAPGTQVNCRAFFSGGTKRLTLGTKIKGVSPPVFNKTHFIGGDILNWNYQWKQLSQYSWWTSGIFLDDASTIWWYQHTKAGLMKQSTVYI